MDMNLPALDNEHASQERIHSATLNTFQTELEDKIRERNPKENPGVYKPPFPGYINDGIPTAFQSITYYCKDEPLFYDSQEEFMPTQIVYCPLDLENSDFDLDSDVVDTCSRLYL